MNARMADMLIAMLAGGAAAPADQPLFRVCEKPPGLDYVNISGGKDQLPIIEQNGQGLALLDYDGDGRMDVFVTNGGTLENWRAGRHPGCRLYRNLGSWRFEDVTASAGVTGQAWSNGCAAADYDDDGDMDLYVANWGPNVLYRNNGDGTFTDVTAASGVGDPSWSSSAVFADFNGDGLLDLYVSNYVDFDPDRVPATEADGAPCTYRGVVTGCGPWRYPGQRDTLYVQTSGGKFIDASADWNLECTAGFRGMGIAPGDFDGDGDVDVYIGCDVMPNLHLENVNRQGFESVGMTRGGALNADGRHESGMGVAAADLFNRGRLDVLTTNFAGEKNTYYRNSEGVFDDRSTAIGFDRHVAELGWGVVVVDFNQDGLRDVFVANGQIYPQVEQLHDAEDRYAQPPRVYLGAGNEKLAELTTEQAFAFSRPVAFSLRAAVAGDIDNDGDIDVLAVQHNRPLVAFENRSNRPAAAIALRTRRGGLSPHGAEIRIGDWRHHHWPTQGYQSSHDPRVFISHSPMSQVTVRWPDHVEEVFAAPPSGRQTVWQQGRGRPLAPSTQPAPASSD